MDGPDDPAVQAAFDAHPTAVRDRLLALRRLILETAGDTPGVGRIVETLKWGQPSYLTEAPKSGTPVRLGAVRSHPEEAALFVHCGTSLIETYDSLYGDTLRFEGRRAVLIPPEGPLAEDALRHCIALALTYHLKS